MVCDSVHSSRTKGGVEEGFITFLRFSRRVSASKMLQNKTGSWKGFNSKSLKKSRQNKQTSKVTKKKITKLQQSHILFYLEPQILSLSQFPSFGLFLFSGTQRLFLCVLKIKTNNFSSKSWFKMDILESYPMFVSGFKDSQIRFKSG